MFIDDCVRNEDGLGILFTGAEVSWGVSLCNCIKLFNSKGVICVSCGIYFTASSIPEV